MRVNIMPAPTAARAQKDCFCYRDRIKFEFDCFAEGFGVRHSGDNLRVNLP